MNCNRLLYKRTKPKDCVKKIVVTTRKKDTKKIKEVLKDTFYALEEEGDLIIVNVYVYDAELDSLIGILGDTIDLRYKDSMIEVYTPDFMISPVLSRSEEKIRLEEKTPVEKLVGSTRPHVRLDASKIALTSVAGMVALTGLFLDSVAIVIGAMLLSPLLGPIYAFAINTAVGNVRYVLKSLINLAVLLVMVIFFALLTTFILSSIVPLELTPEILARMDANFIYILMAVFLGFASIFALSRDISESIAGVAIAAALLPPAVVTGICLVLHPQEAANPLVLTLENVFGLMAGSLLAILVLDIEPRRHYRRTVARRIIVRISLILVIFLGLLFISSWLL